MNEDKKTNEVENELDPATGDSEDGAEASTSGGSAASEPAPAEGSATEMASEAGASADPNIIDATGSGESAKSEPLAGLGKNKYIWGIIVVLAVLLGLGWWLISSGSAGADPDLNSASVTRAYPEVVAKINGTDVPKAELIESLASMGQQAQAQGADLNDEATMDLIEEQALTSLINTKLLLEAAAKAGVTVTEEDIDAQYALLEQQLGGSEALAAQIESLGLTAEDVRQDVAQQLTIEKYLSQEVPMDSLNVSESEIQSFYDGITAGGAELPPLDEIRAQIAAQISSEKQRDGIQALIDSLREQADIETFI